jgi:hypothetical protein
MKFREWLRYIGILLLDWYGIKVSKPAVMVFKLVRSLLWMRFRKHAPHKWVPTSNRERKRTGVYNRCSRCGAGRG